ncbi:unnamed protein product [Clonostachys rosea f. rosea IK726]|uniref:Uncharacterized protein n=1 Tax=Clonostachys rosea f. rosea IK726 TaxID=1349383 RepID=A0ACA9TV89_BIOOC|nr:unnamed protein product [Clonostachys rosea f. rosea IK726]
MAPSEKSSKVPSTPPEAEGPKDTVAHFLFRWALLILALSVLYKTYLHNTVSLMFGLGNAALPIEDFDYSCERLQHTDLQACEHLWLDHQSRKLYAACTTPESRSAWSPGGNKYNVSGRAGSDHIAVLNIDEPGADGLYGLKKVEVAAGFTSTLDLHGFDAKRVNGRLRFWIINHKPPVNETTGEIIADPSLGANSTVEIFDLNPKSNQLEHVKTVFDPAIIAPNGVTVDKDAIGFAVTNDHNSKVGRFRDLEIFTGGGSIVHCQSDTGKCNFAAVQDMKFPNGIVRGSDGLYYVAHSVGGFVAVYKLSGETLSKVDEINVKMTVDNLSVDEEGNVLVAAFPVPLKVPASVEKPYSVNAPATALMLQKRLDSESQGQGIGAYNIVKLIEDRDAKILPTTTIVVRDAKSGTLFLSGVASPFMAICKPRP